MLLGRLLVTQEGKQHAQWNATPLMSTHCGMLVFRCVFPHSGIDSWHRRSEFSPIFLSFFKSFSAFDRA